jgi:hypothetical protein
MPDPITVIIPARNEAATIAPVVETMLAMPDVAEVVVIDNGSDDGTEAVAREAGARVIPEARAGMGHAVRTGVAAARHDWVMKVDADLGRFDTALFARMGEARAPGIGLVKGAWNDPQDPMPMTRLMVRPALRLMFPGLGDLRAPNSGIYLFDRSGIAHDRLTGNYAVDLDVMLRVHASGAGVAEVDIGRIVHDSRDPDHYSAMAEELLGFLLSRQPLDLLEEVVILADDGVQAARRATGLLAQKLIAGARVTACVDDAAPLDGALAGFPTFRALPLDAAAQLAAHPTARAMRVIVPAGGPAREAGDALAARLSLPVEIWEMPGDAGWCADTGVDPGEGGAIRREVLAAIAPETTPAPREVFRRVALRCP